jgi:hypothetical protein
MTYDYTHLLNISFHIKGQERSSELAVENKLVKGAIYSFNLNVKKLYLKGK